MGRYKIDDEIKQNPNKRHGKCEQCGKKTILRRISIYNESWLCETCRKTHYTK